MLPLWNFCLWTRNIRSRLLCLNVESRSLENSLQVEFSRTLQQRTSAAAFYSPSSAHTPLQAGVLMPDGVRPRSGRRSPPGQCRCLLWHCGLNPPPPPTPPLLYISCLFHYSIRLVCSCRLHLPLQSSCCVATWRACVSPRRQNRINYCIAVGEQSIRVT